MILDALAHRRRYHSIHPAFVQALEFLSSTDLHRLPPGRHDLDGDRLYVLVAQENGRGRGGARLEVHRAHIDIQVAVNGAEEIGWMALADCRSPGGPFESERDVGFFDDQPHTGLALAPGHFAVFFPDDAHAPLAGVGPLKKAVVKILL